MTLVHDTFLGWLNVQGGTSNPQRSKVCYSLHNPAETIKSPNELKTYTYTIILYVPLRVLSQSSRYCAVAKSCSSTILGSPGDVIHTSVTHSLRRECIAERSQNYSIRHFCHARNRHADVMSTFCPGVDQSQDAQTYRLHNAPRHPAGFPQGFIVNLAGASRLEPAMSASNVDRQVIRS